MKQWMGVDVGDATIKAALFEPGSGQSTRLAAARAMDLKRCFCVKRRCADRQGCLPG